MNRFIATMLAFCLIFTSTACTSQKAAPELRVGTYIGSASYSSPDYNKTWHIELTFNDDFTFTLVNENGEEKGAGTYAQADSGYTMTYTDGRTCTFTILEDGTLSLTDPLPYGTASLDPAKVGDILLTYAGETLEIQQADAETTATQKP